LLLVNAMGLRGDAVNVGAPFADGAGVFARVSRNGHRYGNVTKPVGAAMSQKRPCFKNERRAVWEGGFTMIGFVKHRNPFFNTNGFLKFLYEAERLRPILTR
jgi:hypothetical protein